MTVLIRPHDPNATFEVETFDRTYCSGDGEDWPVRICKPQSDGSVPVLIDVHGEACTRGSYPNNENVDHALAASGVLIMALEIQQSPKHIYPAQVQDVNNGTRWAKTSELPRRLGSGCRGFTRSVRPDGNKRDYG